MLCSSGRPCRTAAVKPRSHGSRALVRGSPTTRRGKAVVTVAKVTRSLGTASQQRPGWLRRETSTRARGMWGEAGGVRRRGLPVLEFMGSISCGPVQERPPRPRASRRRCSPGPDRIVLGAPHDRGATLTRDGEEASAAAAATAAALLPPSNAPPLPPIRRRQVGLAGLVVGPTPSGCRAGHGLKLSTLTYNISSNIRFRVDGGRHECRQSRRCYPPPSCTAPSCRSASGQMEQASIKSCHARARASEAGCWPWHCRQRGEYLLSRTAARIEPPGRARADRHGSIQGMAARCP